MTRENEPGHRRRRRGAYALLVLLAVGGAGVLLWPRLFHDPALLEALAQRGSVIVASDIALPAIEGTELKPLASFPRVADALAGSDPRRLADALDAARAQALLLSTELATPPREGSVRSQLAHYQSVDGLRGLYLDAGHALYGLEPTHHLSAAHRQALAVVARGILRGKPPPRIGSFPAELRRVHPVEVMVLLRRGERSRLWRSARGSSLARALITASVVARKRWLEREQAMGAALDDVLPKLHVEVALLEDDGTIGERTPQFIDLVFGPEHGVAYERKGAWRYMLPADTQQAAKGRESQAYEKLFVEDGLPPESFERPDLRLYRLRTRSLAVSPPEPQPRDGLGEVEPDEFAAP